MPCKPGSASQFKADLIKTDGADEFPHPYGFMAEGVTLLPAPLVPLFERGEDLYQTALSSTAGGHNAGDKTAALHKLSQLHKLAELLHSGQHFRLPVAPDESKMQGRCDAWMLLDLPASLRYATQETPLTLLTSTKVDGLLSAFSEDSTLTSVALAVVEVKRRSGSTLDGLSQAMLGAMGTAFLLWRAGLAADAVVVPFISYTGTAIAIGAAYLLPTGMPCTALYHHGVLDSMEDARHAAAHVIELKAWAAKLASRVQQVGAAQIAAINARGARLERAIFKSDGLVFAKDVTCLFRERERDEMHQRLCVFEALRRARVPTVLPLGCVAHWGADMSAADKIVFPNMRLAGFEPGLPSNADLRQGWLEAVVAALQCLHGVGYVHLDVHPFNVLWRKVGLETAAAAAEEEGDEVPLPAVPALPLAEASARHWAAQAARLAVKDSRGSVEVLLVDMDSTCSLWLPVGERLASTLGRSSWSRACHPSLLAGERPPASADWFMLLGVVKLSNWWWDGQNLAPLKNELERWNKQLVDAASALSETLDSTKSLREAVDAMREHVPPRTPPKEH